MIKITVSEDKKELLNTEVNFVLAFLETEDMEKSTNNTRVVGARTITAGEFYPNDVYFLGKQIFRFICKASASAGDPDYSLLLSKLFEGINSELAEKAKGRVDHDNRGHQ